VNRGRVVHQYVETPRLIRDALEQRLHHGVVAMIALYGETFAADFIDLRRCVSKTAAERNALEATETLAGRTSGDIHRHARAAQRKRNALAYATTCTGDYSDPW
jgi:hypothetical protein